MLFSAAAAAVVLLGTASALQAQDFPYNVSYNGESSILTTGEQSSANAATLQYWRDWRTNWIVAFGSNAYRVLFQDTSNNSSTRTVSEGIGYGMLLCVWMNDTGDHDRFDGLLQYYNDHLNSNGLMKYKLEADGTPTSDGTGDATDGDEDVALAMIIASKKWGDGGRFNYTNEAKRTIGQIKYWDVENNYTVNGGSPFSQKRPNPSPTEILFNGSYFAPAWYRIFGDFTGDQNFWNNVISKGYQILYASRNSNTGLVPHYSNDSGGVYNGNTYDYSDYQYDAVRIPFRTNLDYAWYSNSDGQNIASKIGAFYATQVNSDKNAVYDTHIYATRATDGTVRGQYGSRLFDGNAGIGFLANGDRTNARFMFDAIAANASYDRTLYFDGAWSLFCRLLLTGNFPNLYTSGGGGSGGSGSGAPIGQVVSFYSAPAGYYVTADYLESHNWLRATRATTVQDWEKFSVEDAGNGMIALKDSNGYYVSCDLNDYAAVRDFGATTIGSWEKFTWVDLGGGNLALKANANGYYVSCNLNDGNILEANLQTSYIGTWETFHDPISTPFTPAGVKAAAGAVGTKKITVSWNKAPGATGYKVSRSTSSGGTYTQVGTTTTALSFANTGLTAGTTYYYKVAATNSQGSSSQSVTVSARAQ